MDESEVNPHVFDRLQNEYKRLKRKKYPHFDLSNTKAQVTAFSKAALMCQKHNISPELYIAAMFDKFGVDLYPSMISTSKGFAIYLKYKHLNEENPSDTYSFNLNYFTNVIKNTSFSLEEVLLNDVYPFDAWFRCLISKDKIESVSAKYGEFAQEQLTQNPKLVSFLKSKKLNIDRLLTKK